MARWNRRAIARDKQGEIVAAQDAPSGCSTIACSCCRSVKEVTPDPSDGVLYCSKCWANYNTVCGNGAKDGFASAWSLHPPSADSDSDDGFWSLSDAVELSRQKMRENVFSCFADRRSNDSPLGVGLRPSTRGYLGNFKDNETLERGIVETEKCPRENSGDSLNCKGVFDSSRAEQLVLKPSPHKRGRRGKEYPWNSSSVIKPSFVPADGGESESEPAHGSETKYLPAAAVSAINPECVPENWQNCDAELRSVTEASCQAGGSSSSSGAPSLPPAAQEFAGANASSSAIRLSPVLEVLRQQVAAGLRGQEAEELQREEIETMSAIFGDAFQVLSPLAEGPLVVRLEIVAEVANGCVTEIYVNTPEGNILMGEATEIPPAKLVCALPACYPVDGSNKVVFALEVPHMAQEEVQQIEAALADMALDRADGEMLLFNWATELQDRLQLPKLIVLKQSPPEIAMQIAVDLLSHDAQAKEDRRRIAVHTCPVCMDEVAGSRGHFISECGHFGCRSCLEQMAQLHTGETDINALRCPVFECRQAFSLDDARELLGVGSEALKKWEEMSLRRCLDQMDDIVYCPRCDADGGGARVPCIVEEDHMARCSACFFAFCSRCKGVYHPGSECGTVDDRIELLKAKARGTGREANAAQAELMTLRMLQKSTKSCPTCGATIEKSEGCNKIICSNCNNAFCWRCHKQVKGYEHFATSQCRLYSADEFLRLRGRATRQEIEANEAMFLAAVLGEDALAPGGDIQPPSCPSCSKPVFREGTNNHLRCPQCRAHFCARCREILPKGKPGDHFHRLKVCPQHGD